MFKKLLFSVWVITSCFLPQAKSQSPRLQLYEVFSGEMCPPCAPTNVYLHGLALQNTQNVLMIKYQVNIPSAGPIYNQNTTDPTARRSYYSVTSAPNARHDGTTIGNGHGANLTQAIINSRISVISPFSLSLQHSFNSNRDSILISLTITATQAVQTGSRVAHLAIIEKHMSYPTAPGSNGETDFYNVVRKMLPSANGTSLPSTWTSGQSQVINISAPVPPYIRDFAEIAVVAFIQENTTKAIDQCTISEPLPVPIYSQAINYDTTFYRCNPAFSPSLIVENLGTSTLTSLKISQTVGTATIITPWVGALQTGNTVSIPLSPVTLPSGLTNFTLRIDSMNGQSHPSPVRSTVNGKLFYSSSTVNQVSNSFGTSTFPPSGFAVLNNSTGTTNGWTLGTQGANGTIRSARMNFYDIPEGDINDLYLPRLNLSSIGSNHSLRFYLAHAQYLFTSGQTTNDRLDIEASTDCGTTWNTIYSLSGADLATVAPSSTAFTPSLAANWRQETVSLNAVVGQPDVLIRFRAISDYGNNLYIDEINAPLSTVAVEEHNTEHEFQLFPNPTADYLKIRLRKPVDESTDLIIRNSMGQIVYHQLWSNDSGSIEAEVNTRDFPSGFYQIELISQVNKTSSKFLVAH